MARHDMKGVKEDGVSEPEVIEDKESGILEGMKKTRDKLKLGPHHKMERFSILTGVALLFMMVFTVVSFASHRSDVSNLASSQAMFTEAFSFSLSGQSGEVHGVYGDENNTDVMLLFKLSDVTTMSTDAENYELFVTGDGKSVSAEAAPDTHFSLFGTTGYGLVRFTSSDGEPIDSQILNVTIRSNTTLASGGSGAVESESGVIDESFNEFDQAQIFVNPGANNVETLEGLNVGEDNPATLYTALVAEEQETEIMASIDETTSELSTLLNRADEYTNRLTAADFIPPEEPWFIAGDYVEDGVFHANENVSRAHDFDYTTKTIRDGYLLQVINDLSEYEDYMLSKSEKNVDRLEDVDENRLEEVPRVPTLDKEDGSTVQLDTIVTGSSSSTNVAAKDSAEALVSTWSTYLREKQTLQRDLLGQLLVLDADVIAQNESYTERRDAATYY